MMNRVLVVLSALFLYALTVAVASPKKYDPNEQRNFQPINRYYESNLPNTSDNSTQDKIDFKPEFKPIEPKISPSTASSKDDRLRFGVPLSGYGNTGNGASYGGTGGYAMSPMKIDIGGIALGALIGLGVILILPKLSTVFSGSHSYRNLENDMSSVTEILARIDNSLEQHNIDSSSCVQRVICTYVNDAQKNLEQGEANAVDQFIYTLSNNSLFSYMLDGTAVKEAVEMGKRGDVEKCSSLYSKCPISKENVIKVISSLLPA